MPRIPISANYKPRNQLTSAERISVAKKRFRLPRWMNHPTTMKRILDVYEDYLKFTTYPQLVEKYNVSIAQIKKDIHRAQELAYYEFADSLDNIIMESVEARKVNMRRIDREIEYLQSPSGRSDSKGNSSSQRVGELLKLRAAEQTSIEKLLSLHHPSIAEGFQKLPKNPSKDTTTEGALVIDLTGNGETFQIEAPVNEDGVLDLEQ